MRKLSVILLALGVGACSANSLSETTEWRNREMAVVASLDEETLEALLMQISEERPDSMMHVDCESYDTRHESMMRSYQGHRMHRGRMNRTMNGRHCL